MGHFDELFSNRNKTANGSLFLGGHCQNIDSSVQWYSDILGFTVSGRNENRERGFKQANLKRDNILLELLELNQAVSAKDVIPGYDDQTRIIGLFKTGYLVQDFEKWMARLNVNKISFHGRVVTDPVSGKKMIIILDPDGNRIQLFEK